MAIDEIAVKKGHNYMTVVLDYDTGRVVWMGEGRQTATIVTFTPSAPLLLLDAWCLSRMQYTPSQQVQFRSDVHLPFDQLEPVHLPLQLGVAPVSRQRRLYRFVVRFQARGERPKLARHGPVPRTLDPGIQLTAS